MRHTVTAATIALAAFLAIGLALMPACGSSTTTAADTSTSAIYPMFLDDNNDGINDYYQSATHDPGSAGARMSGIGGAAHDFVDNDGDGICDYAQNGSPTWHGPGWVDADNNGVCDYWQESHAQYGMNGGMTYRDMNLNGINDYMELFAHQGYGHDYVDLDGDGICDYAQNGETQGWHGPNWVDDDGNGMADYWQAGGRGHGGMMGGGSPMM